MKIFNWDLRDAIKSLYNEKNFPPKLIFFPSSYFYRWKSQREWSLNDFNKIEWYTEEIIKDVVDVISLDRYAIRLVKVNFLRI